MDTFLILMNPNLNIKLMKYHYTATELFRILLNLNAQHPQNLYKIGD